MIQTAGVGALALALGLWLTKRVKILRDFCVPSPVSGGLVFSLLALALYEFAGIEVTFDVTLKEVFMLAFFTCVGFQSDLKVLRQGGKLLVVMLVLLALIMVVQNAMPLGLAKLMGVDPLVGIAAGSVSMAGGHGTSVGFSGVLEGMGLQGAETIAMSAATFGLVAGSMLGGPLADLLIRKRLKEKVQGSEELELVPEKDLPHPNHRHVERAIYWIVLVMAGGTLVSRLLAKTGITFPTYFGSLILAAVVRNILEAVSGTRGLGTREGVSGKLGSGTNVSVSGKRVGEVLGGTLDMRSVVSVSRICLSMFLGMAMISLKLWELSSLALPLLVMLLCQVVLIAAISWFVAFPLLGKDYDAAVLVAGICGFGLGAIPNAMANMNAICNKYHHCVKPFLIVPIVGAMFVDLINTGIIIWFLALL